MLVLIPFGGQSTLTYFQLHTPTAPRNIAAAIAPYVDQHQVKRSSIATGLVQPEDLNRAITVTEGGRWRGIVRPVETGCQVVLDQRISRSYSKETKETKET